MSCFRSCLSVLMAIVTALSGHNPAARQPVGASAPEAPVEAVCSFDKFDLPAWRHTAADMPCLEAADLEQSLASALSRHSAVAVSVAVIEGGAVTQSAAWGWAVTGQREMTAGTKVRVASLSKVAVGLCAAAMAEDGLLDLDAPLSTYWGSGVGNPYTGVQPSARSLMSHTSSLREMELSRGLSHLRALLSSSSSWRQVVPGDGRGWSYSNMGFAVLGTTLELAGDTTLDVYFQRRFLQGLGARASLHAGNLAAEEVACLYGPGGSVARTPAQQTGQSVPQEIGMGATYFPGGLTISAVDLAKLTAILAGDGCYEGQRYLKVETVEELEEPQFTVTPESGTPFEQCLVLRRQEDLLGQPVLCYHTGSAYGVYSLLSYNPDTGDGVVVLTTGASYQVDERGLYVLCAEISGDLYARMEESR